MNAADPTGLAARACGRALGHGDRTASAPLVAPAAGSPLTFFLNANQRRTGTMTIETNKIPPTMSGSKLKVLCALAEAEEAKEALSMTDLAKTAGVSKAAMTGVADALTKDGLAQRRRASDDRRTQCLELTRDGLALVEGMRAPRHEKGKEAA